MGRAPDPGRRRLCRRPVGAGDPRVPRHPHRAGARQPVQEPPARREPRSLPPYARRRLPRGRAGAAREDRHGVGQHEHARPGALSHPSRRAPAHRRRLVHLPHLRLRARAVGRDRGRDPLPVHPRIRRSSPALRLVDRPAAGADGPAAIRVLAPRSEPHRALQAAADPARRRRPGRRLGRSAYAYAPRPAPARGAAGGGPRFREPARDLQDERRPGRGRHVRPRRARVSERDGATAARRVAAPQTGDRELSRGRDRVARRGQQSRGPGRGHATGAVRPHALHRGGRLHGGTAEEILPAGAGPRGPPALRLFRDLPARGQGLLRRGD